ncbi:hypothetical protein [Paraburkholderia phenoliruptrix]|uniref:hypothetical protein n=1 Tax=Paraburkholderia phenoliruptrix TaxID=252970 RepID=UPI003D96FF21
MSFRWTAPGGGEWTAGKPPPAWIYVVLLILLVCAFLVGTLVTWPHGKSIASQDFVLTALIDPFVLWMAFCFVLYVSMYDSMAFEVAVKNSARWHLITGWQRQLRAGMAVLDSVMLVPEPDLAERMLGLEGTPPENPGKVMRLDSVEGDDAMSRERALLEKLLTPLAARLATAAKSDLFEIVIQCERADSSIVLQEVWEKVGLPGKPVVRWMDNSRDVGFVEDWFKEDRRPRWYGHDPTPKCQLVLAWHLNDEKSEVEPRVSEAAVALLLGSSAHMRENPALKCQAWLLREIVTDAADADRALASLLGSEQVPRERIRHFWRSRLKGIAQHATLGAVKESGLKVEDHALDPAIGPQAPVARWLLQALAAKMAHFGQGAQLVALPQARRVALNIVIRDMPAANVPWKKEYDYEARLFPMFELAGLACLWTCLVLMSPDKTWGTFETVFTVVLILAFFLCLAWRLFFGPRIYTDEVWRKYG